MSISILVAYAKNKVIGAQGVIPWNLPSERNRFKRICSGKTIIMGRKSFEEIGHPLSYCTILIVSRTMQTVSEGCLLAHSFDDAVSMIDDEKEILVAGGEEIYRQALPYTSKIYATEIQSDFPGDTFFPELKDGEWDVTVEEEHRENGLMYRYLTLTRI